MFIFDRTRRETAGRQAPSLSAILLLQGGISATVSVWLLWNNCKLVSTCVGMWRMRCSLWFHKSCNDISAAPLIKLQAMQSHKNVTAAKQWTQTGQIDVNSSWHIGPRCDCGWFQHQTGIREEGAAYKINFFKGRLGSDKISCRVLKELAVELAAVVTALLGQTREWHNPHRLDRSYNIASIQEMQRSSCLKLPTCLAHVRAVKRYGTQLSVSIS